MFVFTLDFRGLFFVQLMSLLKLGDNWRQQKWIPKNFFWKVKVKELLCSKTKEEGILKVVRSDPSIALGNHCHCHHNDFHFRQHHHHHRNDFNFHHHHHHQEDHPGRDRDLAGESEDDSVVFLETIRDTFLDPFCWCWWQWWLKWCQWLFWW